MEEGDVKVGLVREDIYLQHITDDFHPENPHRLESIYQTVGTMDQEGLVTIPARLASEEEIGLIHEAPYIRSIRETKGKAQRRLDPDTVTSAQSYDAACTAVGGVLCLADAVISGAVDNGFALVRPPGHHAEPDRAMGFCIFNNVAVAAARAVESGKKVAIVDWDTHHGNGTQKIFYGTDKVLYCSVHHTDLFPGTGWIDEIGTGAGRGFTLNVPIRGGSTLAEYVYVFDQVIIPAIDRFLPDTVIVSAGLDPLADDPVGGMALIPDDFGVLTGLLLDHARGPLALVLEGGYGSSIRPAVHAIFRALQGEIPEFRRATPKESTVRVVSQLKKLVG